MSEGAWAAPVAPQKKTGWASWSPFQRIVIVLGIAIGVGFVFLMIAGGAGYWWLTARGDQVPGRVVVSERSKGFVAVHPAPDDPGVAATLAVVENKLAELDRRKRSGRVPETVQKLLDMRQQFSGVKLLVPREAWVSLEPGSDDVELVASVNLQGFGGLMRAVSWFAARTTEEAAKTRGADDEDAAQVVRHRGRAIHVNGALVMALAESTLLLGTDVDHVRAVLDRVDDAPKVAGTLPDRFAEASATLSEGTDAHFVLDEPRDSLPWVVADWPETSKRVLGQLRRLSASADLVSADEVRGVILFDAVDGASPNDVRDVVEIAAVYLTDRAKERGLALEVQTELGKAPHTVSARYRVTGLEAKLTAMLDAIPDEATVPEPDAEPARDGPGE